MVHTLADRNPIYLRVFEEHNSLLDGLQLRERVEDAVDD